MAPKPLRPNRRRRAGSAPARLLSCPPAQRPPGYPPGFERTVRLADRRAVFIRPIIPADGPELAEAIRTADPDTLYRRFLGAPPAVTPALVERLTTVDYVTRFALVARDPASGEGVAVARYEPMGDGVAEVAVAVAPAWRDVGLATTLVQLLAEAAVERGVRTFGASYLADNLPVTELLVDVGAAGAQRIRQRIRQGIGEVAVALDGRQPDE